MFDFGLPSIRHDHIVSHSTCIALFDTHFITLPICSFRRYLLAVVCFLPSLSRADISVPEHSDVHPACTDTTSPYPFPLPSFHHLRDVARVGLVDELHWNWEHNTISSVVAWSLVLIVCVYALRLRLFLSI